MQRVGHQGSGPFGVRCLHFPPLLLPRFRAVFDPLHLVGRRGPLSALSPSQVWGRLCREREGSEVQTKVRRECRASIEESRIGSPASLCSPESSALPTPAPTAANPRTNRQKRRQKRPGKEKNEEKKTTEEKETSGPNNDGSEAKQATAAARATEAFSSSKTACPPQWGSAGEAPGLASNRGKGEKKVEIDEREAVGVFYEDLLELLSENRRNEKCVSLRLGFPTSLWTLLLALHLFAETGKFALQLQESSLREPECPRRRRRRVLHALQSLFPLLRHKGLLSLLQLVEKPEEKGKG
ncbi:UNVERIFIED_CONTAM: hypothetical protein HHA_321370 [Hammondia hammondi]|eukprot:XP_008888476.1 hypothetical protein HHA_321370 [Hammondia hammondi]